MKHNPRKSNASIAEVSSKTTVENKLTHASLMLSYDFDRGVDLKNRIIKLTGDVDPNMWDLLDSSLNQLESMGKSTITIKINSGGGSIYDALAIVGRIRASKAYIVTEGYGQVMSAATLILASGKHRKMSKYGFFMWHAQSYSAHDRHPIIKNLVEQAEREEQSWAKWMAELSSKNKDFWQKTGASLDAYFTAEELLKLGVVDEIF